MIEVTKDRLDEARFFLGQLRRQQVAQARPEKPPAVHFRYYLNAFLSAARSVTWVLKWEETEKHAAWLPLWEGQLDDADKALYKLTTEMRNAATKRGGVQTRARSKEVKVTRRLPAPGTGAYIHAIRARYSALGRTASEFRYVELQGKEQEVVSVCEQYVELLTRLVDDFIAKHPENG